MYSTIKTTDMNTEEQRDELLWRIAKKKGSL